MKQLVYLFCLLFLQSIYAFGSNLNFYQEKQRGWFWFEQKMPEEAKIKQNSSGLASSGSALDELHAFQKSLEESRAAMIMRPSVENTMKYLKYQREVFLRSDIVSKNWQEAMLIDASLNVARNIPISDQAVRIRESASRLEEEKLLKEFGKKFKLLFFYRKSCNYCLDFANVLEVFARQYNFKVASITLDGGIIKAFPASSSANLIKKFNIQSTPSLFAYSESLGFLVPITHQYLALDLLKRNAAFVAESLGGML